VIQVVAADAALLVAQLIADEDAYTMGIDGERELSDVKDFARFVAQHNWRDSTAMADLGAAVGEAASRAFHGRHADDRKRTQGAITEVLSTI
jgi:hypothetical protein